MKITERDTEQPGFWRLHYEAEKSVDLALGHPSDMTDRQAKARSDAIDALAKAMLVLKAVAA